MAIALQAATVDSQYLHSQRGTLILVALGAISAVLVVIGISASPHTLFVLPILMVSAWLFRSLTIEVDGDQLSWHFGSGFIRKAVPLRDIVSVQMVRTTFLEGWGIHLSRFGWLYNVSGRDAVAVILRNGKRFALGTDEPHKLLRAIEAGRQQA